MMRLPPRPGERIDRNQRVAFSFEGRTYEGFAGDTVASALAANGVRTLSRSFKYRRPRGVLTMAGQDANRLASLGKMLTADAVEYATVQGVMLHGGLAIQRLSRADARETLGIISEIEG